MMKMFVTSNHYYKNICFTRKIFEMKRKFTKIFTLQQKCLNETLKYFLSVLGKRETLMLGQYFMTVLAILSMAYTV